MVTGPLTRKLFRDLNQHKLAMSALLAIIAIGVGVFVSVLGAYRDLDRARADYYDQYRISDFIVDLKRAPNWTVEEVEKLPNIRDVRGRVHMATRVDLPDVPQPISGVALSVPADRRPVVNDVFLKSGLWFSGAHAREVILNETFAEAHDLKPGDRLHVLLLDKEHDLLVVGTAMSPEYVYVIPPSGGLAPDPARFAVLYLPDGFARESCDLDGAYNQLVGRLWDSTRPVARGTLDLIESRLDPYGVTNVTPAWEQASVRFVADELTGLKATASTMPVIFLGVAALVVNVLLGRIVRQQRAIIGTLRALGYSRRDITLHYLSFGLTIGALGALLGMLLGWFLQLYFLDIYRQFYRIPNILSRFYPDVMLLGLLVSLFFSVVGTLGAVKRTWRLEPAEAMRPPPPERGSRILLERFELLWTSISFRWKMVLRAIFRNPFRSTVCVLATIVSTSMVLATVTMVDALDYLIDFQFSRVAHQDYTLTLRDAEAMRAVSELNAIPGIRSVEPELAVVCDLTNGPFQKRIGIIGIRPDSRLDTPLDRAGNRIVVPQRGLVLERKLAELINVKIGDRLRLRPLIGQRRSVETYVAATVDGFLGLSAYADLDYLSRLLGEDQCANVLLATADRHVPTETIMTDFKKRPAVVGLGERQRTLTQINETFGETMGQNLTVMVIFAGLISFGSVLNAAIVSLSERRREVGTLRVLGYTNRQVGALFAWESLLLNGIGVLVGLAGGVGLANLLSLAYDTELYRFPVVIYPARVLHAVLIMVAFLLLAQWLVQGMIRRLPWLEVLNVKE